MNSSTHNILSHTSRLHSAFYRYFGVLLCVVAALCCSFHSAARDADYYAAASKLANGRWAKIKVERTGMQFVSKATLNALGFTDHSKVNAYGYGGALISENLSDPQPDDLPLVPTVHTPNGILFFGNDIFRRTLSQDSHMSFGHSSNPYSDESWYFLSDITPTDTTLPISDLTAESADVVTTFTEQLIYEKDLVAPSNTGRILLGEDFRSPSNRTFTFQLGDNTGEDVRFKVTFATLTGSSPSSLAFSVNGNKLNSTISDAIPAITNSEQFMRYATTSHSASNVGNNMQLNIQFNGNGNVQMARLDYIEVEYTRRLRLTDGQLYFQTAHTVPTAMRLAGCNAGVTILDVTDPSDIREVKTTLSGTDATFVADSGLRKYIAYNPNVPGYNISSTAAVSNQDIHSLETPDMLIVTPAAYMTAAQRLAQHHADHDGMSVHILTPEAIYNEFSSGTPDVSAMRKLLKMWYDRATAVDKTPVKYCLLMSRPTYDHKTASRSADWELIPTWLSEGGISQTTSYSTEDFIGMLDDTPSLQAFNIARQKIHVAVGRLPVISAEEADVMVNKIINYVENPELGAWRNNIMLIADDQDNGVHLNQAENVYKAMNNNEVGNSYLYDRIYLDAYRMVATSTGDTYPDAKERMLKLWNDGIAYIDYIGHASPKEWGHEDFLNWTDINSFSNTRLPFLYAATCDFARWDAIDRSGAEVLWLYPTAGIIATICPNRTVYITQNGTLNLSTHTNIFNQGRMSPKRIGDLMIEGKNGVTNIDDNKLRYILIGDPAMALPIPTHSVALDNIMQTPTDDITDELPVIPARGKVELAGSILKPDGSTDTSFNGILHIQMHDAEMPIETNGNGASGVVSVYNDRKTKLFSGSCRVKDGKWSTTLLMPSEIENNYSPARMTFYASAEDGLEANGSFDRFYVYGYDENADADTDGPDISLFALNRQDFEDGGAVHSNPIVLASFSDPSGINLSDAGIGHKITLCLDRNTYFEDVNSYYTSDPDNMTAGSIVYPMPELSAGEHTLKLTVWDNANNSSSRTINFNVGVAMQPVIYNLDTDVSPAREAVNFMLSTDRPMAKLDCTIEVFDLNGRRVWMSNEQSVTDIASALTVYWNLCDDSGTRVPRGIYLYRATIQSPEGTSTTASKKLAVTGL
ncbi:MAG: type IX secretion system sortase PorU [Muribaculaceae bacterium]|nr:type IX secretion system sortase PorU [Muribaculaceae bacterium]